LGAGESGKSTIFKQMKIMHQNGFSTQECSQYRDTVHGNILKAIKALIENTLAFDIPIEEPENRKRAEKFNDFDDDVIMAISKVWDQEMANDIKMVWHDAGIQKVYTRRNEYQLDDSTYYYMTNIDRIGQPNYVPSQEDVLRTRIKTTGVVEMTYKIKDQTIRLLDVGGQRNERKKWMHCFEGVNAVIFVMSAAEYDMKCYEDNETPRMQESMDLFAETVNSKWFVDTPIILFMNKVDLFREKIKTSPITAMFPEYSGGSDPDTNLNYIKTKFEERNKFKERPIVAHVTSATDTESLKNAFGAITDVLLNSKPNKKPV